MGAKGLVWSAASMGILLGEGIGDTIRISLTPRPGGDRREEVYAACELLQSLGLRTFAPSVTACPGCGRTTSTTFQELAESIQGYIRDKMPEWKRHYEGVEELKLAIMGCIVNGPGESKAANIGISLPGTGESPRCPFTSTASISRRWKEITTNCRRPFRLYSMITSKRSITSAKHRSQPLPRPSLPRPPSLPSASSLNGFTPRATRFSRIARDVPAAHALPRTFRAAALHRSPALAGLAGKVPVR